MTLLGSSLTRIARASARIVSKRALRPQAQRLSPLRFARQASPKAKRATLGLAALGVTLTTSLPALAQPSLSAAEFESYVQGKTLFFGLNGKAYGAERYMPNRTVTWSYLDGECKEGHWYEDAGMICFVYEDTGGPQCWSFYREGARLRAVFENDPSATVLYEAEQDDKPMMCQGPDVGV